MNKQTRLSSAKLKPVQFVLSAILAFITAMPFQAIGAVLEEITVTATRRGDTDIMTTPVAVTALSDTDVEKLEMRDLNDLAVAVPGLSSATVSAFRSASFAMRGVSETTIIVYKESPVAVTLDDFVMPHIQTSNLEMFDIEAVEVLRGPQGTLFGKNTTAGAINVRTKRPELDKGSVDLRFAYGDFDTKKVTAALNLPFNDTVAFRFAGMYLNSDGYYKNGAKYGPLGAVAPLDPAFAGLSGQGDGRDLGGDDVFSARFKLLWEPNEDFSALFQYEVIRDDGDTPPIVNESPDSYLLPLWGYPAATGDPLDSAGVFFRNENGINVSNGHQVDIDGFYLNAEWNLNDDFTMYSNIGYREQESRLPSTYTGTVGPQSLFDATRDDDRETFQAEARFVSQYDGPFNFVTGVYFQTDEVDFCVTQQVGFLDNFFLGTPSRFFNDGPLILCNNQEAEAAAVFLDGTYDFTDRLHLTAGLRVSTEEKKWAGRPRVGFALLDGAPSLTDEDELLDFGNFDKYPTGVVRNQERWTEPTYRINLGYDFSEDHFGYISYSHGFKSGGYNDQVGTQLNPIVPLAAEPTDPEFADSFEIGLRSSFLDGAATLGLTAFYVEYTDAQRTLNATFPTGQETLFFNAAEMEVKGLEWEGNWAATDNLTLRFNGSWNDADFNSFEADTNFDGVIDIDLSGSPVQRVPEWMLGADATYVHYMKDSGDIAFNFRVSYEDDSIQSYGPSEEFNTILNSKTLVDISVKYTTADEKYFVKLIGKNLLDERYRTGSLSVAQIWVMSAYGAPRFFGAEVGMNLDL
ncbi:MAG: TonB-dependent receptor [Pseudomonadota bacterium]